jgi:hypothetical protein
MLIKFILIGATIGHLLTAFVMAQFLRFLHCFHQVLYYQTYCLRIVTMSYFCVVYGLFLLLIYLVLRELLIGIEVINYPLFRVSYYFVTHLRGKADSLIIGVMFNHASKPLSYLQHWDDCLSQSKSCCVVGTSTAHVIQLSAIHELI